ncbi:NUDIX hydrolase [Methylibium petroleiphilum]|uniref:NUDIX hydrolase n=1 Tax=Methylibium petroleiphilum TaxID=105560 RepID=UPI001ACDE98D|nr:DUF4743 domain-containing protein [Methylibium petroleiphilum]MBN9205617.1 DUF4743 domain-containing protein [Methylibium petroleiphilum]
MSGLRPPASETTPDPQRDFLAIDAAQRHDAAARRPLHLGDRAVGSVAAGALPVLRVHAPWLQERDDGVLSTALRDEALDAAFAATHAALRECGLITGWRDEIYAVAPAWGAPVLARIERAAARFWGTLTFGAHANGYVSGPDGRPSHLWIAQRSPHKATDPGKFDNLIGGGVPHGQTPFETLVREGWEEAGLAADLVLRATRGRVIDLQRTLPDCAGHGLQREQLFVYDLALPPGLQPRNQDGEVASLQLLPVAEALALAAGDTMTVDAALATLDFALRWRLLGEHEQAALTARTAGLFGAMPD